MSMDLKASLPADLQRLVHKAEQEWQDSDGVRWLWAKDASLWTNEDEADGLGWLDMVPHQGQDLEQLSDLQEAVRNADFESAVVIGTGSSSSCVEAFADAFGRQDNFPSLQIVNTTDPARIRALCEKLDMQKTLFVISSKRGAALEPNLLRAYFLQEAKNELAEDATSHFFAITDPGSRLDNLAREERFRQIYDASSSTTEPYAALTSFGIVPAAIAGLNLKTLLSGIQAVTAACRMENLSKNPGVHLGVVLGTAALNRRDKLTFILSPEIHSLGKWLEQIVANATGKDGKGIIPVDGEHIAPASHYGKDRIFAYIKLEGSKNVSLEKKVAGLEAAGQPVVRFCLNNLYDITQQFFIWQIAVAVAASLLGVNPFKQPDTEATSMETRILLDDYLETGKLAVREPVYAEHGEHGILLYASRKYAARLKKTAGEKAKLEALLKAHFDQIRPGDYCAILPYLEITQANLEAIQFFRHQVRGAKKVATTLGVGPGFEHSTGQVYKGGPNSGVFLQITAEHTSDLQVPGAGYSFATATDALAAGDLAVLEQRGRRVVRVHLGQDIKAGLKRLSDMIESALKES